MATTARAIVGNCIICDVALYEGDEYTDIPTVAAGSDFWAGLYCKNCHARDKSKGEARITLSEIPMMVAKHYAALVPFVDRDLVYSLTRDYHNHLLSIATVGNLPEQPTESGGDRWTSVHDMMPKEGDSVLIWIGGYERAHMGAWYPSSKSYSERWHDDNGERLDPAEVTHWQPLPGKPEALE